MEEPSFNEGQLQQLANAELANYVRNEYGITTHPIIPTGAEENRDGWGWDTGFEIPWLGEGNVALSKRGLLLPMSGHAMSSIPMPPRSRSRARRPCPSLLKQCTLSRLCPVSVPLVNAHG